MFKLIFIIIFIFIFIRYLLSYSYSYLSDIKSYICPSAIYICLGAIYICLGAIYRYLLSYSYSYLSDIKSYICPGAIYIQGRIQDLIKGGAPDRDRPKTAILGPQFCRIFGAGASFLVVRGGARAPGAPPGSAPDICLGAIYICPGAIYLSGCQSTQSTCARTPTFTLLLAYVKILMYVTYRYQIYISQ